VNADQSGKDLVNAEKVRKILASQAPPDQKLTQIAKLAAIPPALTPIVLTDRKKEP
jgi:hypothetical protein